MSPNMRNEMMTLFFNSVSTEFRELLAARTRRREDLESSSSSSSSSSNSESEEERDELLQLLDMINEVNVDYFANMLLYTV